MSKIYKKWQEFILNERNYTKEELASDSRWNDLSQGEIDGFFWTAAGGASLEDLTRAIYGLAEDAGRDEILRLFSDAIKAEKLPLANTIQRTSYK